MNTEIKNSSDFIPLALRTKSDKFYGELVELEYFRDLLANCIDVANELDKVKKALFYGKGEKPQEGVLTLQVVEAKEGQTQEEFEATIDVIHGILGCFTEAGEMLEVLNKWSNGEVADLVNLKEEIFDQQWYHAILCARLGITFEQGQQTIINKLRKRFPEKFTTENANNRNLDAERQTLEANFSNHSGSA